MNKGIIIVNVHPMSVTKAVQASRKLEIEPRMMEFLKEQINNSPLLLSDFSGLVSKKNPNGPVKDMASRIEQRFRRQGHLAVSVPAMHENDKYSLGIFPFDMYLGGVKDASALLPPTINLDLAMVIDPKNGAVNDYCRYSFHPLPYEAHGSLPLLFFANLLNAGSPDKVMAPVIAMLEANIAEEFGIAIPKE
jgi:hypothetical protein